MAVPDRPDPDDIITSAWGDWVHDHLKAAGPPTRYTPTATGWPATIVGDWVQIGQLAHVRLLLTTTGTATTAPLVVPLPVAPVADALDLGLSASWVASGVAYPLGVIAYATPARAGFYLVGTDGPYGFLNMNGLNPGSVPVGAVLRASLTYLAATPAAVALPAPDDELEAEAKPA